MYRLQLMEEKSVLLPVSQHTSRSYRSAPWVCFAVDLISKVVDCCLHYEVKMEVKNKTTFSLKSLDICSEMKACHTCRKRKINIALNTNTEINWKGYANIKVFLELMEHSSMNPFLFLFVWIFFIFTSLVSSHEYTCIFVS